MGCLYTGALVSSDSIPVIERVLLITWLVKDFGWMTTNIFLGFPFGIISVAIHALLVCCDPRHSHKYYNYSLMCWVIGNFIWMTIEFVCITPSSRVHAGPDVPLGGISEPVANFLVQFKTCCFLLGAIIQVGMYIGMICTHKIEMPEDNEEETSYFIAKNEAQMLYVKACQKGKVRHSLEFDLATLNDEVAGPDIGHHPFTLAFIEYAYIIFWIFKDLFWSWGTGDLTKGRSLAIFYESAAMLFGCLSISVYLVTAYIFRRNIVDLLDCITTICWISANFVWMSGEFFVRYHHLDYDDSTQRNDEAPRWAACGLFGLGLALQVVLLVRWLALARYGNKPQERWRHSHSHSHSNRRGHVTNKGQPLFEWVNMSSGAAVAAGRGYDKCGSLCDGSSQHSLASEHDHHDNDNVNDTYNDDIHCSAGSEEEQKQSVKPPSYPDTKPAAPHMIELVTMHTIKNSNTTDTYTPLTLAIDLE